MSWVLVAALDVDPARTYHLAIMGRIAMNQQSDRGADDMEFSYVPDLRLKQVVGQALVDG